MRRGLERLRTWTAARRATALAFLLLLLLAGWLDVGLLEGSTSATRLLGTVPFVDPLATLEAGVASGRLTETMVLGTGILLAIALLLGPVFCGWVCPLGLALDLNQAGLRAVRRRLGRRSPAAPVRTPLGARYAVLGVVVGVAIVAQVPLFQVLSPINLLVRGLIYGAVLGLVLVLLVGLVEWFAPRLWCRGLCPLGALYALLGRFALLRVRIDPEQVRHNPCGLCASDCPMGIPVMERHVPDGKASVDDPSCTRCGSCVDACPRGTLHLGFARPGAEAAPRG